jgi:hypothetical protein
LGRRIHVQKRTKIHNFFIFFILKTGDTLFTNTDGEAIRKEERKKKGAV